MALPVGTKLGPYEVQSQLGVGGMGEVYRARDSRLDRTVAIKILASHLSSYPELKQRMEREARTISSLNHPHICHLYDIGSQNDVDFLVMEFLDGETLAERLRKGPLPLHEILRTGIAIAEALAAAHRQGIVHRDLKPGNIMLTQVAAKLMDFGLAKPSGLTNASSASGTAVPSFTAAPTLSGPSPLTPLAPSSALSSTCRPSRSKAKKPTPAPTSSPSALCFTRWLPVSDRFRGKVRSRWRRQFSKAIPTPSARFSRLLHLRSSTSSPPASRRILATATLRLMTSNSSCNGSRPKNLARKNPHLTSPRRIQICVLTSCGQHSHSSRLFSAQSVEQSFTAKLQSHPSTPSSMHPRRLVSISPATQPVLPSSHLMAAPSLSPQPAPMATKQYGCAPLTPSKRTNSPGPTTPSFLSGLSTTARLGSLPREN